MQNTEIKTLRRRLRSSYITSIISISLVLYLLGLIGLLLLNTKKISDHVKETLGLQIFLKEETRTTDILRLQKIINLKEYIKDTKYITAEEAAEDFKKEHGEDFVEFIGSNPMQPLFEVKLIASYTNEDSMAMIEGELQQYPEINEVYYQPSLIKAVNQNVKKISFVILAVSAILFLISLALINNTVRLAIYSKRFLIRTMQLVGATGNFIRQPFLYRSIVHGSIGSLLSVIYLFLSIFFLERELEGVVGFKDYIILIILFVVILLLGVLINWLSTFFSVNKYLKIKTDYLYL